MLSGQDCRIKVVKFFSSVEEIRSSVYIVNLISRVVCAEHTIWTLKNPITCSFTSHLSCLYFTVLNEIAYFLDSAGSFRWMKLFLLVFLLLYTEGVLEHQQATWLSDLSRLTNGCTTREYSDKFCSH